MIKIVFFLILKVEYQYIVLTTCKIFKFWTVFATFFPSRLIHETYTEEYTLTNGNYNLKMRDILRQSKICKKA